MNKWFRDATHYTIRNDGNQKELISVRKAAMRSVLEHPEIAIPINVQMYQVCACSKKNIPFFFLLSSKWSSKADEVAELESACHQLRT